jgi:2,3-bisphosphoglycerate-dependent phosphoglycerate mutase
MPQIVLIRHGQSQWNLENRFTGWTDVDLSPTGIEEAKSAGKLLLEKGYTFDLTYTSYLTRAIKTLNLILEEMNLLWLPVHKHWKLNERHYGALQGLNKLETAQKYGDEQVHIWRRSYSTQPPALEVNDDRSPAFDTRYKSLSKDEIPLTESLSDTVKRVLPYWEKNILRKVLDNKKVLISAHGNSLRAIIKIIEKISDEKIVELEIPTGKPLVYNLDEHGRFVEKFYL